MARPRVFVSSTFYDLKHIRASLEVFIESLGFDAILFEKGDISFHPDLPLDESCYREAANADIFVLIIGGRYGSATSETPKQTSERISYYESITKKEFETAQKGDVPTFILLDSAVSAEYQTYLRNRDNTTIVYAHVDSTGVFKLLDAVFEKSRNNPVFNFDRATQIETWLREQWAGLFRELLNSRSQQRQLAALNSQVSELQDVNATLKTYLEEVLTSVTPDKSAKIISEEEDKLNKSRQDAQLRENTFYRYFHETMSADRAAIVAAIMNPSTADEVIQQTDDLSKDSDNDSSSVLRRSKGAQDDYNKARILIGFPPIDFEKSSDLQVVETARRSANERNPRRRRSRQQINLPVETEDSAAFGGEHLS